MSGKLAAELKQGKPFASLEHEALLNLAKTASVLGQAEAAMLKPFDLSPAQYNVLRILKGAGEGGRNCQEIGERLVAKDPDITRLIDRLMDRGLVTRARSEEALLNSAASRRPRSMAETISPPGSAFTAAPMAVNTSIEMPTVRNLRPLKSSSLVIGFLNQPSGCVGIGP